MNRVVSRTAVPIQPVEQGYVAEGPGFYVWDEDRDEVIRVVRELTLGGGEVTPTRRMLRILTEPETLATTHESLGSIS